MLDLHRLSHQFPDFTLYQQEEQVRLKNKLDAALQAWEGCQATWEDVRAKVQKAPPRWLVAGLRTAPGQTFVATPRPTPITVVATDGSQIYPDRNVEPTCYLLNVSRIAFHYGTLEQPLMESVPLFRFRRTELDALGDEPEEAFTAEVVSALRDELELEALLDVAQITQIADRPLLAMADGTLIRWMLRGMQNTSLAQRLIERYVALLTQFQEAAIPLCSYISFPGNTEVINLLRVYRGETDESAQREADTLAGLTDRKLFEHILGAGERSVVFESASHVLREYGESSICYFYVKLTTPEGRGEIGRVEFPRWLADREEGVGLLHAVVLSECEKGNGYPMILSEAHERAVIRGHEKALFYDLIERQMATAGLSFSGSRKQASKRNPIV